MIDKKAQQTALAIMLAFILLSAGALLSIEYSGITGFAIAAAPPTHSNPIFNATSI